MKHEGHICLFFSHMPPLLSVKNSLDHMCVQYLTKVAGAKIIYDFLPALTHLMNSWAYGIRCCSIRLYYLVILPQMARVCRDLS